MLATAASIEREGEKERERERAGEREREGGRDEESLATQAKRTWPKRTPTEKAARETGNFSHELRLILFFQEFSRGGPRFPCLSP